MSRKTGGIKQKPTNNHMLAAERHRRILELTRREGAVKTTELGRALGVTEETIRRDLEFLAAKGHLLRTHGGAMDPAASITEPPHAEREARQSEEKAAIAREAARLVVAGETLLLDASSSALALASQLPADMRLRVVTYSLAVVERLAGREDIELVQLGGLFDRRGRRFHGMLTEMALRALRIDRFFFSGGGFHPEHGVGEPNPDQARLKQMMLSHAEWSCALLDHTKLGRSTDHFFAKPGDLDALVTDKGGADFAQNHLKSIPYALHLSK
jgi:DeoR/GlpR family transcriptional regulator of sugar metabolism